MFHCIDRLLGDALGLVCCMTGDMHLQVHLGDHVLIDGTTAENVKTTWIFQVEELYNTKEVPFPGVCTLMHH